MEKISIIDYGSGNLLSVYKALKFVSGSTYDIRITSNEAEVSSSDKIVFPGQGAIKDCMKNLKKQKLDQTITKLTKNRPFFGICLGLQSLMEFSEEGGGDRVAAWKMHVDAGSGTPYWHNVDTNETTWESPGSGVDFI